MIVKHRRGTTQDWLEVDIIPEEGELVIEECQDGTRKCKIGTGYTRFSKLPYTDDHTRESLLLKLTDTKEELNTAINALRDETLENIGLTNAELSSKHDVTKAALESAIILSTNDNKAYIDTKVAVEANARKAEVKELCDKLSETETAILEQVHDIKTDIFGNLYDRVDAIADTLSTTSTAIENVDNKVTVLTENVETRFNSQSTDYNNKIAIVASKAEADKENFSEQLKLTTSNFTNKLNTTVETFNSKFTELEQQEKYLAGQLTDFEVKTEKDLASLNALVKAEVNELNSVVEAKSIELANSLSTTATDLDSRMAQLSTSLELVEDELHNTIAEQVDNLTSTISKTSENILELNTDFKKTTKTLQNNITEVSSDVASLAAHVDNIADKTDASIEDLSIHIDEVADELNDKLNNQQAFFDKKLTDASVNLANDLSITLTSDYTRKINVAKQELQNRIQTIATSQENDIATLRTDLSTSINDVKEDLNVTANLVAELEETDKVLATALSTIEDNSNEAISALRSQIKTLKSTVNDLSTNIRSVAGQLDNTEEKLLANFEELSDNLATFIDEITTYISEKDAELASNLETSVDELTTLVLGKSKELNTKLSENIETLRSSSNIKFMEVQSELSNLDRKIQATEATTLNKFTTFEETFAAEKDTIKESIGTVTSGLDSVSARLDRTDEKIKEQARRIDNIIVPSSSTLTRDEEVIDIRVGYNGIDYACAGDAVRAIGEDLDNLKESLPEYIPANAVDGLEYVDNQLYLVSKGVQIGNAVTITGGTGGGGSVSTVKVTNNLPSTSFTVSKGTEAWIDFTYTSFENEVSTGDGTYKVLINDKATEGLSGTIQHGVAKRINVIEYLKNGSNNVKVVCTDQYGVSRNLVYTISVIELRIESSFNSTQIFNDTITFRYKIFGQVEKTAYVLVDGVEVSNKKLGASVSGSENTLLIPKQSHGCHKITAYVSATLNDTTITSNILEYEILCTEADNNTAMIASIYEVAEVSQGDLISIPFIIYDPVKISTNVELTTYAQVAGELIEVDRTTVTADRRTQFWNTRKYPVGTVVFTISYTYDLYGVQTTITKAHTVKVNALEVDVNPEEDSLQLYLTAQGRSNTEQNPAIWAFTQAPNGDKVYSTITTSFSGFNWKSNGWITENGDTCLRLNGDARAVIDFKPFKDDFKVNGKTIEFEFVVRDVNDRDAIIIDCFDGERGFRATPDTAFLKSSGSEVSCRYKDEERVRVAITVEHAETTSRFVSIYLDGVLSGVQRYATTDIFSQDNPLTISLGSSLCGLDVYNIRIYDKALSTQAVLTNYIADQTVPATRLQLMTDNDILDENGQVSYDRVKALGQIPIITFTGPMPAYKGDKIKNKTRMKFEDPAHPEMNFDVLLDQIDVQGTSSQFYIRKNWKVKLPEKRAHMPGAIPAKVFCIKVDYAEATGTHNTGSANFIETLYDREEVTLPPQKDDTRVRTTIQGFPIIIFEKETEDSEPIFSSKGNFNYDKDAENAFGFTEDYKDYGVECWEFCNNTSDPVNFAGEIPAEWLDDFEPRYVPESANFERIEELQEIAELAASGKGIITEAQKNELATLMRNCIANFKEMHDWVLSTATYTLVDGKRVPIVPVPLTESVTYGETTYTEDNEEYRLAKFKYEFKNYFNMHYTSMYYVFTFFALMTDQRAKNLFLTRWKEDDGVYRWYPYFYDNDTIFGINNEGALVFDYFHEDTDQLGSSNVYNGQNSVFWHNFRLCFPQEISSTYSALRSSNKLTYGKIIDQFVTNGSDKYSEAIYNADADYKYVSMAREAIEHTDEEGNVISGIDASNLYQVRGKGEQHLRYFIANRLNYCDSKWYAGNYPSDDIFLRIYTPKPADDATQDEIDRINASLAAVPANPAISIIPFSDMYAGVRYKSGTLQQQRLKAGESYTFSPPNANETFGDTETAIYGAGEISSLGDLSGLYCGVINLSNARKLTELTVGNANPAYYNDNFREISVGNNRLLRYIDLRNCSGLGIAGENPQKTLELSGCPNIEHIYTEGTNLSSVDLPDSGYVKTLHLPKSINTLVVQNQKNITDFAIEDNDYSNIRTLRIENSSLDTNTILEACRDENGKYTVARVRLTDISWGTSDEPLANADFIKSLFPAYDESGNLISGIRGIDDKNNPLDDAYIVGTCYIAELTGEDYTEIKAHYPYLDIKYGKMTSNIIFMAADGKTELYREIVTAFNSATNNCADPVHTNKIAEPTKESTAEFDYKWIGWTRKHDGELHADALLAITGDRTLYPVFAAIRRSYVITFMNPTAPEGNQLLAEINTPYGSDADYSNAGYPIPTKQDAASPDLYTFIGWHPKPEKITGPMTCYAQFTINDNKWYTIGIGDITNCIGPNGTTFDGYTLNTSDSTMSITECTNNFNAAVIIPNTLIIDTNTFTVTKLSGFSGHDKLELVRLPETLIELLSNAFASCVNLNEITLPQSLQRIGDRALQACTKLREITIPAGVTYISDAALSECVSLEKIIVANGNTRYAVQQDCLIDTVNKRLIQGLVSGVIPQDGSVTNLGVYCFASMPITSIQIPDSITAISDNSFSRCAKLKEVKLPNTIKTLGATCFAWCSSLSDIDLPEGLTDIMTYVFYLCPMEEVVIPSTINNILDRAFCEASNLRTVTFKKALEADGTVKVPYIHSGAFYGTGKENTPVVFNCPWSEAQHKAHFEGVDGEGKVKDPTFGANYYIFNFDYKEAN